MYARNSSPARRPTSISSGVGSLISRSRPAASTSDQPANVWWSSCGTPSISLITATGSG